MKPLSADRAQPGQRARIAGDEGRLCLESLTASGVIASLRDDPQAGPLLQQLREDLAELDRATALRLGAARRLQGASARRRRAAQDLFDACADIRRRVKLRFRGPGHLALRRAFGEGLEASPGKPGGVLAFAARLIAAAPAHAEALAAVRLRSVQRLVRLQEQLRAGAEDRLSLRADRHKLTETLGELALRVVRTSAALQEIAAQGAAAAPAPAASTHSDEGAPC